MAGRKPGTGRPAVYQAAACRAALARDPSGRQVEQPSVCARSGERRGRPECVRTCRSRWSPETFKNKTKRQSTCTHFTTIAICMSEWCCECCFFFFKQKTAYEMRISDWSSDVCSSDLRWTS